MSKKNKVGNPSHLLISKYVTKLQESRQYGARIKTDM